VIIPPHRFVLLETYGGTWEFFLKAGMETLFSTPSLPIKEARVV
jgi:hypothetical protein